MIVRENEKVLLIKYSDMYIKDSINAHLEVLKLKGSCWFGKFGAKTSEKNIKKIMNSDSPKIILTHKKNFYICAIEKITTEPPTKNYPSYYDEYNIKKDMTIFFKINKIIKLDNSYLEYFVVNSSLNPLANAINQSMASQFLLRCEENLNIKEVI